MSHLFRRVKVRVGRKAWIGRDSAPRKDEMKKLTMTIELTYDDEIMHEDNEEAKAWFFNDVLNDPTEGSLILHSNYLGDEVGTVRILSIDGKPVPPVKGE